MREPFQEPAAVRNISSFNHLSPDIDVFLYVSNGDFGLALVKRAVDIVGGEISVESEVGKGSVFTVRLGRENDGAV